MRKEGNRLVIEPPPQSSLLAVLIALTSLDEDLSTYSWLTPDRVDL